MQASEILGLVMRWLHILAAITAVGGTIFARFVVLPVLDPLEPSQRQALHAALRARWSKIVTAAIAFLLISGLYNASQAMIHYTLPAWYQVLFGVKFLAALVIFGVASLLVGRSPASDEIRKQARMWLNLNVALAVLVVCLSGVLRTAVKVPKTPSETTSGPVAAPVDR